MSDRHYVHHHDEVQLAKLLKESKPFLEKYGTTMIYALAAVMAIAAVVIYMQRRESPTAEASNQLLLATTAEDYRDVANEFPDSPIGLLSRLREADRELEDAVASMFTNREAALENLANAEKAYKQLQNRSDVSNDIRERVLVGLARVAECRCDGTDETMNAAVAAWNQVLQSFPDSKTFKSVAEARIKRLATTDSREFYAWFHQQNPKPGDDLLMPQDGKPGQIPSIPNFPSLQDFGLPTDQSAAPTVPQKSSGEEATSKGPAEPAKDAAKAEAPAEGTPAEPSATPEPTSDAKKDAPAADAPAAETPKVDAPAGDAPPAEAPQAETPATEAPAGDTPPPEKSGE